LELQEDGKQDCGTEVFALFAVLLGLFLSAFAMAVAMVVVGFVVTFGFVLLLATTAERREKMQRTKKKLKTNFIQSNSIWSRLGANRKVSP